MKVRPEPRIVGPSRLEETVMARVDAGERLIEIARDLEITLKTVQRITGYLAPTAPSDRWETAAVRSSERLLAAISRYHPDQVTQ